MVSDIRSRDVDRSITCHHVFCIKLVFTGYVLLLWLSHSPCLIDYGSHLHKSRYAQEIEEKFPKVCDNGVES